MATFIENVQAMTDVIRAEKARTRLSEPTLVRVVEMNLSMMMNQPSMPQGMPEDDDIDPMDPALDAAMTPELTVVPDEATIDPTTEDA